MYVKVNILYLHISLEFQFEDPDITEKKKEIELCLENPDVINVDKWENFAKTKAGLISGK